MTRLLRVTQLVRFRHGLKPSVTTSIPRSQTVTLPQFSTKTSATRLRDRSPANDAQPTAFTTPTVCGEEFIHIRDLNTESLSDSVVQIDQPLEADTVGTAAAAAAVVAAAAAAAAAKPAPETSVGWDRHPAALPEELSRNVIHLSCESTAEGGVCDVYLVGTFHRSKESCRRVRAIVNFLKPEAVFFELCRSRVPVLPHEAKQENVKVSSLEFHPDSEFAVAYEEAIKYGGRVILGDRPLEITIERAWSKMPLWSKTKAVFSYWFPTVFLSSSDDLNEMEIEEIDATTAAAMSCKGYPTLKEAIVHERDQYMSAKLLQVASESRSVVAVVGRGHLQGIKKNWKQPIVLEDLMTVPSPKPGWVRHPVALPEELSRNVIHLSCESTAKGGVCDVYLVGTIHLSEESYRQVRAIVKFLKPEAVFLELCSSRMPVLPPEEKNVKIEFHPGSELAVAYEEAIKYGGRVILGDRPLEITLKRAWSKMPLWSKTKALFSAWFPTVSVSRSDDLNEMEMDDSATAPIFCKEFPTLKEAFVHERDQYMSSKLLEVASESRSVVAVVGRGHLRGMKKNWKQPVVLEDLMTVPPPISATSILTSYGLSQAGLYIIWRLYRKCKK